MKSFENRRAQIDAYKRNKKNTKSLEINDKTTSSNDIVSFEVKGKGEGKEDTSSPISSSSPIAGEEEQTGNATSQADKTKDTYRFEQYNPDTGERPYCGIPIPHDARPNRTTRRHKAKKQKTGILTTFFVIQIVAKDDISRAVIFETSPCFF